MPTRKPRRRSRTMWTASAVTALGAAQVAFPVLVDAIPKVWYGVAFIGIGVAFAVLREFTHDPVRSSRDNEPLPPG